MLRVEHRRTASSMRPMIGQDQSRPVACAGRQDFRILSRASGTGDYRHCTQLVHGAGQVQDVLLSTGETIGVGQS